MKLEAPTSKSMTQRALLIAALAEGPTRIERPLDCDDSRYLVGLLEALGCAVEAERDALTVMPAPLVAGGKPVFCGNAGTAVRFGACLSLVCDGELVIDGDAHMRKRPIGPLADSLRELGITVKYLGAPGCPPIALARHAEAPASVAVDTSVSSQYASGLLLVAPRLAHGLVVELTGAMVSAPYLDMTIAMMRAAGAGVARPAPDVIEVSPQGYPARSAPRRIAIEPDWSAAAFVLAAGRLAGVPVEIPGLPSVSLQGDAVFAKLLESLDAGTRELDLRDAPDLIAPLAVLCLFAKQPTRIVGVAHARVKESDRIAVLARGFRQVGADVSELPDGLDIQPLSNPTREPVSLDPEDDHRMAMAFGLLSLRVAGITVRNPDCVSKSFPTFWEMLRELRPY
jgi:3-phosphoshikimate 1-carboxyvinyltransferase